MNHLYSILWELSSKSHAPFLDQIIFKLLLSLIFLGSSHFPLHLLPSNSCPSYSFSSVPKRVSPNHNSHSPTPILVSPFPPASSLSRVRSIFSHWGHIRQSSAVYVRALGPDSVCCMVDGSASEISQGPGLLRLLTFLWGCSSLLSETIPWESEPFTISHPGKPNSLGLGAERKLFSRLKKKAFMHMTYSSC